MASKDSLSDDKRTYHVVVNAEGQYSLLMAGKEVPRGWKHADRIGTKAECLSYIKEVWTDMTPLSLTNRTSEAGDRSTPVFSMNGSGQYHTQDLVQRLSEGDHPVEITRSASETQEALREAINEGYLHIKFTDTKGGTELGIRLDPEESEVASADFSAGIGNVKLVGSVTLDKHRVLCVADIDLSTLKGNGHLKNLGSVETTSS